MVSVNEYFPSFKFNSKSRYWNGNPYNSDPGNRNPPERTYVILNRARGEAFAAALHSPHRSDLFGMTVRSGRFATKLPDGVDQDWLKQAVFVLADKVLVEAREHDFALENIPIPKELLGLD